MEMSFKVFDDADTGDEILYFVRRYYRRRDAILLRVPRHYLYLRDAQTKRFIRRLRAMELRMFEVVDYDEEQASKGNPLYVDVVTSTYLFAKEVPEVEEWEERLHEKAKEKTRELFGSFVTYQLLDRSGVEYGSRLRVAFKGKKEEEPKIWFWCVVWKHRKEQEPKSEEGIETW